MKQKSQKSTACTFAQRCSIYELHDTDEIDPGLESLKRSAAEISRQRKIVKDRKIDQKSRAIAAILKMRAKSK